MTKYKHRSVKIEEDAYDYQEFVPPEYVEIPDDAIAITIVVKQGNEEFYGYTSVEWLEPVNESSKDKE